MNLQPWREIAVRHEDVLKGTLQWAEFAADLSRVHDANGLPRASSVRELPVSMMPHGTPARSQARRACCQALI